MLANVLKSDRAIEVSIKIIEIFTKLRELILSHKEMLVKVETLERKVLKQDDRHKKHEEEIQLIFKVLKQLLNPESPPRKRIGFKK
ncbi:MAG: hypothetical protein ACHQF2_09635, partial [Flavobacteriales bacterium]